MTKTYTPNYHYTIWILRNPHSNDTLVFRKDEDDPNHIKVERILACLGSGRSDLTKWINTYDTVDAKSVWYEHVEKGYILQNTCKVGDCK